MVFNSASGGYQFLRFVRFYYWGFNILCHHIDNDGELATSCKWYGGNFSMSLLLLDNLKFRWEWENIVAVPVPYLYPSLKKCYIQSTETVFLIVSYPLGNYFPWWDYPFGDPLWGPNLILFLFYIPPREKFYDFKKHRLGLTFFAFQNFWMWLMQK